MGLLLREELGAPLSCSLLQRAEPTGSVVLGSGAYTTIAAFISPLWLFLVVRTESQPQAYPMGPSFCLLTVPSLPFGPSALEGVVLDHWVLGAPYMSSPATGPLYVLLPLPWANMCAQLVQPLHSRLHGLALRPHTQS